MAVLRPGTGWPPSAISRRSARIITSDRIGSAQPFVRKWRPGHRWRARQSLTRLFIRLSHALRMSSFSRPWFEGARKSDRTSTKACDPQPVHRAGIWFSRALARQRSMAAAIAAAAICFALWRRWKGAPHILPYLVGGWAFPDRLFRPCRFALALRRAVAMTPADAAAADNALELMLWGAIPMLPIILAYTALWVLDLPRQGGRRCRLSLKARPKRAKRNARWANGWRCLRCYGSEVCARGAAVAYALRALIL